jgi:hypothetical protein
MACFLVTSIRSIRVAVSNHADLPLPRSAPVPRMFLQATGCSMLMVVRHDITASEVLGNLLHVFGISNLAFLTHIYGVLVKDWEAWPT